MIVIDTSALVSILLNESDAAFFAGVIHKEAKVLMSAATYLELCLVMKHKKGVASKAFIDQLIELTNIRIEAVTVKQAQIAYKASLEYSVLNYGDTLSYALAKGYEVSLLFKGNDFTKTDLQLITPLIQGLSMKNKEMRLQVVARLILIVDSNENISNPFEFR